MPAMAQVATTQPSLYDSYSLADHPFQIVTVPDYQATPKMQPELLYPDAPYLHADTGGTDPAYDPNATYGTSGLTLRQALGIAGDTSGDVAISADTTYKLSLGTININKADPGTIILRSHNFRIYNQAGGSLDIPAIDVQSGNVLFYTATSNPGYSQFPLKISGTGNVTVYAFESSPQINLTGISNNGSFIGNRYIRFNSTPNSATDLTTLNITDNGYFEVGQNNSINHTVNVLDNSTFILNGGNILSSGGPSPNIITGSVNIGNTSGTDSAYAVFGIQNRIEGDVNVNSNGTLRSLGPTEIQGDLNFSNGSTFIATLGTPINAQEFHYNVAGDGYIGDHTSPDPVTNEPDALTPAGNLAYWNTSGGLSDWQAQYSHFAEQIFDPASTVGAAINDYGAHFYAPPSGTYLLKVDGNITADAGSELILDSVSSLNVGQKYIIFKVNPNSSFTNNFSITNALPTLTFSDLENEISDIDGYTDYYVELTGVDLSALDLTGANKSQRSFFNYLDYITSPPPQTLPPNPNSALAWIISNYNDLGPDTANSFLGNSYAAHDAQLYWNQKAFIDQISNHMGHDSNTTSGHGLFNLNATDLNNVDGQLFSLRQSMDSSRYGLAGALNANGNNGANTNGVWASIYGDRVKTDGDSGLGSMGWDGSTTGFAAGYTGGNDRFKWGVAAGHQKSDLDFDSLVAGADANGKVEGYNLGLYGTLNRKSTYLNGILSYSHFDNDAERTDQIGTNSSSFNSHSIAAQLEYGVHVHQTKKSDFTPYASLLYTHDTRGDITEDGTGAGLSIDSDSHSIVTSQLGVRYNYRLLDKTDAVKGGLVAGLAWQHQFGDTDFPVTARFTGTDGSFNSYGTPLSSNAFQLQLGAYGRLSKNIVGFANYRGTFGDNEKVNAVTAGLGYQF